MPFDIDKIRVGKLASRVLNREAIEKACGEKIVASASFAGINGVTTYDRPFPGRIVFVDKFLERIADELRNSGIDDLLVVCPPAYCDVIGQPGIFTSAPRICFGKVVSALFHGYWDLPGQTIADTANIHSSAQIAGGVFIGAGSEVGAGTIIYSNVVIGPDVKLGSRCIVKSGTVIGQAGFGVNRDERGIPHKMPHVGGVMIGDDVEIGALNTVASGTIHPTVVESDVKTDDHVHIAHNCHIGTRTLITACAELSGSVRIGADCWIGPNASIRDGVAVGDRAFVGIGSNVIAPVAAGSTVYGNPARERASG